MTSTSKDESSGIPGLPLALSIGDPAGVGPAIAADAVARLRDLSIITFGNIADVSLDAIEARAPTAVGGSVQLRWLDAALRAVRNGAARALVTGPVSKQAVHLSGERTFVGQTEHCARAVGLADDAVSMLFLGPRLRIGLVTTHLALRDVATAVTPARIERTAKHLAHALLCLERSSATREIAVASINPHLGEAGAFGDEDERVTIPTARALDEQPRLRALGFRFTAMAAETALRRASIGELAGVVVPFHDQATIASKLVDWARAVNVTWGLPFVRTSVDHGVGYDAARAGKCDAGGLIAALELAAKLADGRAMIGEALP